MLSTLTPEAQALARYMSTLSEQAYFAGWMSGLEFELWRAVVDGPRTYGCLSISREHIDELRRLSDAAGGWIVFDHELEEMLLPMSSWTQRFDAWNRDRTE